MTKALTVVYDACVLYPNYLRDLLIQLATTEQFRAKWTEQIHDEWIRNILKNRPDLSLAQFQKLKDLINASVPDCLVTEFETLIPSLELPDSNDRHVFAAAIIAEADRIITINLKDFPEAALASHNIIAQHPDDFIADLLDRHPRLVLEAVQTIRTRLKKPPVDFNQYMEILLKQGLVVTVSLLRQLENEAK